MGWKAHSGWAVLVALGAGEGPPRVLERRRVDLVEDEWEKQPYHAADGLKPAEARKLVAKGTEAARRNAMREVRAALDRETGGGNKVEACGVLVGEPMPDWSTEQILAVHFRMHKAEGVLFRDALVRAARACGLRTLEIPEKHLMKQAQAALSLSPSAVDATVVSLGRSLGPPWARDHKDAALAALISLSRNVL